MIKNNLFWYFQPASAHQHVSRCSAGGAELIHEERKQQNLHAVFFSKHLKRYWRDISLTTTWENDATFPLLPRIQSWTQESWRGTLVKYVDVPQISAANLRDLLTFLLKKGPDLITDQSSQNGKWIFFKLRTFPILFFIGFATGN